MIARSSSFNPIIISAACVAMFACGCGDGDDAPDTVSVSGKVTVDSKPVTDLSLSIVFTPVEEGSSKSFTVKPDGTYEGEAVPGKNVVSIVVGGGEGASGGHSAPGEETGELVDAEGNPTGKKSPVGGIFMGENSPLTADVKAGGENKFDFEVGTKAAASGG